MKKLIASITILLAATTFGCKDASPPKGEARVETASETARNDDRAIAARLALQKAAVDEAYQKDRARESRQQYVDALRAVGKRWDAALLEASRTPRNAIAAQTTKLQTIRSDAATIDVDDCTSRARITLQSSMAASMEAFSMFQKETGESAEATTQKIQQGSDLLRAAQRETDACLGK